MGRLTREEANSRSTIYCTKVLDILKFGESDCSKYVDFAADTHHRIIDWLLFSSHLQSAAVSDRRPSPGDALAPGATRGTGPPSCWIPPTTNARPNALVVPFLAGPAVDRLWRSR